MTRRTVAPWLLAASVFLTGATTLLGSVTPAQAITSVEELRDVDSSHWAYQALADLVEKYDVIEGYPDYTFKGKRAATRWELAAALNAVMKAVGRDIARLGAEKANKSDLATLARLQEEFRNELAALNSRVGALEARASAIEAKNGEQDTRLDLLERTQLHGDVSLGFLADFADSGQTVGVGADGIRDGVTAIGRVRLGMKVPVVQGYDNSKVGEGDVITRLVGAFGRTAPDAFATNGGTISGYSALAGGASAANEGNNTSSLSTNGVNVGSNTRQNLYIESAYYKQHFKPGIPILTDLLPGVSMFPDNDNFRTTADLYAGVIPWRNLFDRSPYRGDELNQFQNTALVNNAGLLANNVTPTIAMAWHQGLGQHWSADVTAALATLDSGNFANGMTATEELALNYDTSFLGTRYTKPGNAYVGGYHMFFGGNRTLASETFNGGAVLGSFNDRTGTNVINGLGATGQSDADIHAIYGGWNQEWWRGIGTSVGYTLNKTNVNNILVSALKNGTGVNASLNNGGNIVGVSSSLNAVLSLPLTVFNKNLTDRAHDLIGIGYSYIDPTDVGTEGTSTAFKNDKEQIAEVFYRWSINNSFTVIPSVQYIMNRFGVSENNGDVVFGLRTNFVF